MTLRWIFAPALALAAALAIWSPVRAADLRVLPAGQTPKDVRLQPLKDLNDYFPMTVPPTREAWEARKTELQRQLLVGLGLWPLPAKTPLNPVVHGKVERDGFTVERVYFESFPGFYVTGSLFRPTKFSGKRPLVLCPHGHSKDGRLEDAGFATVRKEIVAGEERFDDDGRQPNVARAAQLARMGCVTFLYDMVGYADSVQLQHRYNERRPHMDTPENWGYFSVQAELRLQHMMGLQTWNSIRALDWAASLPDVDPTRIGVTGASGGGTQTFVLGAVDPRPTVIFPAVMVSTAMQGGCTCENCSYLRVGTGNIELAGLFAPKPLGMVGADDWTKEMDAKGYPELQALYRLLGVEKNVFSKVLLQFPHNYNYVSRGVMYPWMNKHLQLGLAEPIVEEHYGRLSRDELTVWDDAHPKPPSGDDFERKLLKTITDDSAEQIGKLIPRDAASFDGWRNFLGPAIHAMIGRRLPEASAVTGERIAERDRGSYLEYPYLLTHAAAGEQVPVIFLYPKQWNKTVVVWLHERGKAGAFDESGAPIPAVKKLLDAGASVVAADLFGQGDFLGDGETLAEQRQGKNSFGYLGFTYGYNRALIAQRTADVLSIVSYCKFHEEKPERIDVVGLGAAGPWAALARAIAGEAIDRAVVDAGGYRFASIVKPSDPQFLPGVVKYGDLPGLLSAGAPHATLVLGEPKLPELAETVYRAAGASEKLTLAPGGAETAADAVAAWLTAK